VTSMKQIETAIGENHCLALLACLGRDGFDFTEALELAGHIHWVA
jgi:hypothetical protein